MRIGIYGGTFDPPHIGHLILAVEAASQLNLDKVLWLLTPAPPHKDNDKIFSLEQRLQLVQAVVRMESIFGLSRVDLDRPGPHYAAHSMQMLNQVFPGEELIYLIGADSLTNMHKWFQPHQLIASTHTFGVMRRPGYTIDMQRVEQDLPGISSKLAFIDTPLLEISSSDIRQRIATGKPFRYFLPQPVYQLIKKHDYYSQSGL